MRTKQRIRPGRLGAGLVMAVCLALASSGCAGLKLGQEGSMNYSALTLSQTAEQWREAVAARDGERIAAFLAEDAVAMYPLPLPTEGREANRAVWTAVFQAPDFTHPIVIDEVVESEQGDLGYTFGRWWAIQPSADQHAGGRFVAVWQPVDGAWQITYLSANAHEDVAAAEPAAQ
jgi:ketosteroid isomerase-like protein